MISTRLKLLAQRSVRLLALCLLLIPSCLPVSSQGAQGAENRILLLNGTDAHISLPSRPFSNLETATLETWVRYDALGNYAPAFSFGQQWQSISLCTLSRTNSLEFFIYDRDRALHQILIPNLITVGQWFHVATVCGPQGMKLYLDGVLVGSNSFRGSFNALDDPHSNSLGKPLWTENSFFKGALDEFRIWSTERTPLEIKRDQFRRLHGDEPGLIALWNFDRSDARDATPQRNDGKVVGAVRFQEQAFMSASQTPRLASVEGRVLGPHEVPEVGATIQYYQGDRLIQQTETDQQGRYQIVSFNNVSSADLLARSAGPASHVALAQWRIGLPVHSPLTNIDFTLSQRIGVSGAVSRLDDSAHPGVYVELQKDGVTVHHTVTGERGTYTFPAVRPGRYRVRCMNGRPPGLRESIVSRTPDSLFESPEFNLEANEHRSDVNFQIPSAGNKGSWRSFTSNQGLPSNQVTSVQQAPDGRLWIGTYGGGLACFDGSEFIVYDRSNGLSSNEVIDLATDAKGQLWIATSKAIQRWTGEGFTEAPTGSSPFSLHVTSNGRVLWCAQDGVYEYRLQGIEKLTSIPSKPFLCLTSDSQGTLWLGGIEGGLGCLKGAVYHEFSSTDYGVPGMVNSIAIDSSSNVWFAVGSGLVRFDGSRFTQFDAASGLSAKPIQGLFIDHSNKLWAGSDEGLFSLSENSFVRHPWPDRLPSGDFYPLSVTLVRTIKQGRLARMRMCNDPSGALWLPSSAGVYRYDPTSVRSFTPADGLPRGTLTLCALRPDGLLVVGAEDFTLTALNVDLALAEKSSGIPARSIDRRSFWPTSLLFDKTGDLWVTSLWGGVRVFDRATLEQKIHLSAPNGLSPVTKSIWESPTGEMWVGTDNGIAIVHPGSPPTVSTPWPELKGVSVNAIYGDRSGKIWAGTENQGLWHLENGRFLNLNPSRFPHIDPVHAITENPSGILWFATDNGLFRYAKLHPGSNFERFSRQHGLPSNTIRSLHPDGPEGLFVGTDSGACRYHGASWTVLDSRDGLAGNKIGGIAPDAQGRWWIACGTGLSCYQPTPAPPLASVVDFEPNPTRNPHTQKATYRTFTEQRTTIYYRSTDLKTIPSKQIFRTRLTPPSDVVIPPWSNPSASTRFDFTPSKPGRYRFEVQSIDRDSNFSPPASLEVEVLTPWHRKPAVVLLVGSAFLGVLGTAAGYGRKYYQQRLASQKLQQNLLEKERSANQAKSLFLANMSHDIRTPLNAILGYTQILQRTKGMPEVAQNSVETIHQSGTELLGLINSILDISKIEAGSLELQENIFDIASMLSSFSATFFPLCERKGLRWNLVWSPFDTSATEPWPQSPPSINVSGDESKVRRILSNLVTNAIKYTDSGSVTLHLICPSLPAMSQASQTCRFVFEVSDTGPGITEEASTELFEPFIRAKKDLLREGHGLGLSIARRLTYAIGGELSLVSPPGHGSTFRVALPLSIQTPTSSPSRKISSVSKGNLSPGQSARILVVDDHPLNRNVLRDLLSLLGADVHTASNGYEALALATDQKTRPELILMDIRMPELDGLQTTRMLRERLKETCPKLVAYSASTLTHEHAHYLKSGFDDFLAKPATVDRIRECLSSNLKVTFESHPQNTPWLLPENPVHIPEPLIEKMLAAAQNYSTTELKRLILEIECLGPAEKQLAAHLSRLNQQSNMLELVSLLRGISASQTGREAQSRLA